MNSRYTLIGIQTRPYATEHPLLPPFTPKLKRYYCSCGCDHVHTTGSTPDGDLVHWEKCACNPTVTHDLLTTKPANYRGDGVMRTH